MSTLATNTFQELATGDSVGAKYVVHGTAKAWANLNGTGTIALRGSLNISSVVDEGTGDYRFNFTNVKANANYAPLATAEVTGAGFPRTVTIHTRSASSLRLTGYTSGSSLALIDLDSAIFGSFGDLA
jgi:hypothetical protein